MKPITFGTLSLAILFSTALPARVCAQSPFPSAEETKSVCEDFAGVIFPTMSLGECMSSIRVRHNSGAFTIFCKLNEELYPDDFYSVWDSVPDCSQAWDRAGAR